MNSSSSSVISFATLLITSVWYLAFVTSAYSDISHQPPSFLFSKSPASRSIKYGFHAVNSVRSDFHRPNKYSTYTPISSKRSPYHSQSKLQAVVSWPLIDLIQKTKIDRVKFVRNSRRFFVIAAGLILGIKSKFSSKLKDAADAMESGWKKRGFGGSFARTIEVWVFVIAFAYRYFKVEKLKKGDPVVYSKAQSALAGVLTEKILQLGPTFIKLGQLLSTRVDILPTEYIEKLVRLQDKVPGFSGDMAVKIIEEQLGKPIDQLYDSFNNTAIAAASLGQVHIAYKNGQKLAVKVQRQGLRELFDMDLKNIKVLAQLLDKFDPKSDGAQRDWSSIFDESSKLLYKEIDYKLEALNCIRFKENFAEYSWVKVPEVMLNMTTSNVITMEFVPGLKINDIQGIEAAGIDRQLLAKYSAESYLTQLCRHGFFHCDPHPGNVACDAVGGGRLIYYDFGMMDELKPEVKDGLVNLIFGVYENDTKEVCDSLEQIGVLKRGVDRLSIEKIVRFFLGEFNTAIKPGEKWVSQLPQEKQREIRRQRRQQLGADLFSVGSDVPFKFPPTFTFVFRAFTTLDGIGKGLDPKYDLTRLAQPFLRELVDLRDGSATISLIKLWARRLGWRPEDIANTVQAPRKVANLESIVTKMEQGDLKLRVRVLESEREFKRMAIVQGNIFSAVAASTFLNVGLVLSSMASSATGAGQLALAARASLVVAGLLGLQVPVGIVKLRRLDKKFAEFGNK